MASGLRPGVALLLGDGVRIAAAGQRKDRGGLIAHPVHVEQFDRVLHGADLVDSGALAVGTRLPPIRQLAQDLELAPGTSVALGKTIALQQLTTRTHYPGEHRFDVVVNGATVGGGTFDLVAAGAVRRQH